MSFLNKYNFRIEPLLGLKSKNEFLSALEAFYSRNMHLGHYQELFRRLALVQGCYPLQSLKPSILTFVADHGISRYADFVGLNSVDSQEAILHALTSPKYFYLKGEEKKTLNHRIIDLGTFNADDNNSTYWMHRGQGLINARINTGSASFSDYPAMTTAECDQAFAVGQKLAAREIYNGVNLLVLNSFGNGDSLSFYALLAALENKSIAHLMNDETLAEFGTKSIQDLAKAIRKHPISHDPFTILSFYGSFETAALCGAILKSAESRVAIILRSPMAKIAALLAFRINDRVLDYCVFANQGALKTSKSQLFSKLAIPYLSLSDFQSREPIDIAAQLQIIEILQNEIIPS
jgi:nicotinate-nucleotide--dimethylbenzimidazole phosphoribosyltransferase